LFFCGRVSDSVTVTLFGEFLNYEQEL